MRLLTILSIGSIVLGQGNIVSDNSFTAYDEVLAGKGRLNTMTPVAAYRNRFVLITLEAVTSKDATKSAMSIIALLIVPFDTGIGRSLLERTSEKYCV